jgi:hypothetical protein
MGKDSLTVIVEAAAHLPVLQFNLIYPLPEEYDHV